MVRSLSTELPAPGGHQEAIRQEADTKPATRIPHQPKMEQTNLGKPPLAKRKEGRKDGRQAKYKFLLNARKAVLPSLTDALPIVNILVNF